MADTREFPEIEFVDRSAEDIFSDLVSSWEAAMGRKLARADPIRLILGWEAAIDAQLYAAINNAAKLNVPRYAYGEYLDSIGENYYYALERLPASPARATVRFTISQSSASATVIPAGTRVTADGTVDFAVETAAEIPAGSLYADVTVVCTQPGTVGNGYPAGEINICVDRDNVRNLASVSSTTASEGGAAAESDEEFYNRMRISLAAYSTAGAAKAYAYHARSASSAVGDVTVDTPEPGEVTVYIMGADGTIPGEALLEEVEDYLNAEDRRPLTDHLTVSAPTAKSFDVAVTWYMQSDSGITQAELAAAVQAAVQRYLAWQTTAIGRDINPSKLTQLLMEAGVKRVTVTSPAFAATAATEVPQADTVTVTYGGTEDA